MESDIIQIIEIPHHGDLRGGLAVAEIGGALSFPVRRAYWIYGTKPGVSRGFHAHKMLRQLCICIAGSVRMVLFDGKDEVSVVLDSPTKGLVIGPGLWREMHDFSTDAILLVLADAEFDESDYIRDRAVFIEMTNE